MPATALKYIADIDVSRVSDALESNQVKYMGFKNSGHKPEVAVSSSITRWRGYFWTYHTYRISQKIIQLNSFNFINGAQNRKWLFPAVTIVGNTLPGFFHTGAIFRNNSVDMFNFLGLPP